MKQIGTCPVFCVSSLQVGVDSVGVGGGGAGPGPCIWLVVICPSTSLPLALRLDAGSPLSLSRPRARLSTGVADRQLDHRLIGGKSRKRGESLPGPLPGRHRLGVLDRSCRTRRSRSEPARRPPGSGRCRSALRAVATFRLSPAGDEPHPGARNRVDHTGGDRGLGPGLPAFASGRPVSPSHSPARFAPVREVPPLRSARRSRPCWPARRTHVPRRRLLPRARGPDT